MLNTFDPVLSQISQKKFDKFLIIASRWTIIAVVNFGKLLCICTFSGVEICLQDGGIPPAYFPPTNFVKNAFWKDENVFFQTNTLSSYFMKFFQI